MPALSFSSSSHQVTNPLDVMEQIVCGHDWAFDRRNESEMAAEAPGKWCDYGLYFSWSREIAAMNFTCTFDLRAPANRRKALYELIALANERLWIGHFSLDLETGTPVFRHSVLLRGATSLAAESMEDMIDIAITECERFYPAFQFTLWSGKTPTEALEAAMLDCVGEA